MRPALQLTFLALFIAVLAGLPMQALAQTPASSPTEKKAAVEKKEGSSAKNEPAGNKARPIPFQGKLSSVDTTAKTLTVGQRTFQVTAETKLSLSDHRTPTTLSAATPGEHVSGSYRKGEDGKLTAVSVYFGDKTDGKAGSKQKAPGEKTKKPSPGQ